MPENRRTKSVPRILTVAGSDSGGGAGIQGDLKTITLLGGFGMTAVTAVTAQNTLGITGILDVPPDFVGEQMEAVLADIGVDAMKTGMLSSAGTVRVVAEKVRKYRISQLVVDPVMISSSGQTLLSPEARTVLISELIPLARVVTPNLREATALAGGRIRTRDDMRAAARKIRKLGPEYVLLKGGHLRGHPVDVLFDGRNFYELRGERLATPHLHGTGCTLSAAIAVELGKGNSVLRSAEKAKEFITCAIRGSLALGRGSGPVNPCAGAGRADPRPFRNPRGTKLAI